MLTDIDTRPRDDAQTGGFAGAAMPGFHTTLKTPFAAVVQRVIDTRKTEGCR